MPSKYVIMVNVRCNENMRYDVMCVIIVQINIKNKILRSSIQVC